MEDCERMKNYCAAKSPLVSRRTLLQSTYVLDKVAVDNQEGNNTASTTQESKMTSGIAVGVHHAPVLINGSWRPTGMRRLELVGLCDKVSSHE
jgi:hypothetical protein